MALPPESLNNFKSATKALGVAGLALGAFSELYQNTNDTYSLQNPDMRFPHDLIRDDVDRSFYVAFNFSEYVKRGIKDSKPFLKSTGGIKLPLPTELRDNINMNYDESASMGAMIGAGMNALASNRESINQFKDTTKDLVKGLTGGNNVSEQAAMIADTLSNNSDKIFGTIGQVATGAGLEVFANNNKTRPIYNAASQLLGVSVNPFLGVAFRSPSFKRHSFSWRMSARNAAESNTIKQIIKTFQYNAVPGFTSKSYLMFKYPNIVQVNLYPNNEFLYKFKPCVITNISVNYAPSTTPSFYRQTNAPTVVEMRIDLTEIEYWTKEDYLPGNLGDADIPVPPEPPLSTSKTAE